MSNPKPLPQCPFYDDYNGEWDHCIVCEHFVTYPELCDRHHEAKVCELDHMTSDVVYFEPEPIMPWE